MYRAGRCGSCVHRACSQSHELPSFIKLKHNFPELGEERAATVFLENDKPVKE